MNLLRKQSGPVVLILALAVLAADVLADGTYNLRFGLASAGTETSASGGLKVRGTSGQPVVGRSDESPLSSGHVLRSGFWTPATAVPTAVGDELPGNPQVNRLNSPYPNPFNPATNVRFELAAPGPVRVKIFNARGQMVRDLVNEDFPAGRHEVLWDGRDDQGGNAPSGIYFVHFVAGGTTGTKKMTLLK